MTSERQEEVAQQFSGEKREVYYDLVADYQQHALERTGRPFISYDIIADLVSDGWRKLGTHIEET